MRIGALWLCLALALTALSACDDSAPIQANSEAAIPQQIPASDSAPASPDNAPDKTTTPTPTARPLADPDISPVPQNSSAASTPEPNPAADTNGLKRGEIRLDPASRVGEFTQYKCTDASQLRYTLSQISSSIAEAANKFPGWVWQCEDTSALKQVLECFPELTQQLLTVLEARSAELVAQLRANDIIFCKPAS